MAMIAAAVAVPSQPASAARIGSKVTASCQSGGAARCLAVSHVVIAYSRETPANHAHSEPSPLVGNEGWTSFSHWVRNTDGSITGDFYTTPTFHQVAGQWVPIDATLAPVTGNAASYLAANALRPILFPGPGPVLYQIALDGGPITWSSTQLTLGLPQVTANALTYTGVATDTNLAYSVGPSGVQEQIVLTAPGAPTSFTFHLADPADQLGAAHVEPNGSIAFGAVIDGDVGIGIPAPMAYPEPPSLFGPHINAPGSATQTIRPDGDGYDLTVSINPTWLAGQAYPIVLDPTTGFYDNSPTGYTQEGIAVRLSQANWGQCSYPYNADGGCYGISYGSANPSYGAGTSTSVDGKYDGEPDRTFMQFDPSQDIPPGDPINYATLVETPDGCVGDGNAGTMSPASDAQWLCSNPPGGSYTLEVHAMDGPWQETGAVAGAPGTAGDDWDTIDTNGNQYSNSCGWGKVDCTAASTLSIGGYSQSAMPTQWDETGLAPLVQSWVNSPGTAYGLETNISNDFPISNDSAPGDPYYNVGGPEWPSSNSSSHSYPERTFLAVSWNTPPGPVSDLQVTSSTDALTATWQPPANNGGSSVTGYYCALDNNGYVPANGQSCPYSGVAPNTTHTISVYAQNSVGAGTVSSASGTTPVDLPGAPQGVSAQPAGVGSVTVSWAQGATGGGTIDNYQISLSPNGPSTTTNSGSIFTVTFNGLSNVTSYTSYVEAHNSAGWGPPASAAVTTSPGYPDAPTTVTANQSGQVHWTAPASNGGAAITSYSVTPYDSTAGANGPTTTITCTSGRPCLATNVNGLIDGHSYYFSVAATNSAGTGPAADSPVVTAEVIQPKETNASGSPLEPHAAAAHCTKALPVNCATGDFWHTFTDLSIQGTSLPLSLERTYNSLNAGTNGPFGYGWSSTATPTLSDVSGVVTITTADGAQVTFTSNGVGGFTAPGRVEGNLIQNSDGSFTLNVDGRLNMSFSATGAYLGESDLNGYAQTVSYSSAGQITQITDPTGRALTFTYNSTGQISQVTDPAGGTVQYFYDPAGDLVKVIDARGQIWQFGYDSSHDLLTMTDPNDGVVENGVTLRGTTTNWYNSSGQITQQEDPAGNYTYFSYTPAGTVVTDPNGNIEDQTYTNGVLTSLTTGAGTASAAATTYEYDSPSLGVTAATDPNGHTTGATYDTSGNMLSSSDGLDRTTLYQYDSLNDLTQVTDPAGETTTAHYDGAGNLQYTSRPAPGGQTEQTTFTYGDSALPGYPTLVTDPMGEQTAYSYFPSGQVEATTNVGDGDTSTYTYDSIGRLHTTVAPNGNVQGADPADFTTTYVYDGAGNVGQITDPLGHKTVYTYDNDQNLASVTTPMGEVTNYYYDSDDRQSAVIGPGTSESFGYDADGHQTTVKDGDGNTTTYSYADPAYPNLTTSQTTPPTQSCPAGCSTGYAYDPAGNLVAVGNGTGETLYGYDAADELHTEAYVTPPSAVVTPDVILSYNLDGELSSEANTTGTPFSRSYNYDSLGRLSGTTEATGSGTTSRTTTVGYGYDLDNRVTSLSPCAFTGICYSFSRIYDNAGRWQSVYDGRGSYTTLAYDADGNITQELYPDGTTASSTYDNADQLIQTTDSTRNAAAIFLNLPSPRNADGLISNGAQLGVGGTNDAVSYSYDGSQRVTGASSADVGTETFGYDSANLLKSWDAAPPVGSPDAALTGNFSYDAAAELTQVTTTGTSTGLSLATTYSYDSNGSRLSETTSDQNQTVYGGASFGYNQAGDLTSLNLTCASQVPTLPWPGILPVPRPIVQIGEPLPCVTQPSSPVAAETFSYDPQGLRTDLGWDLAEGTPSVILDQNGDAYLNGPDGLPVEERVDNAAFYYHHDALGSTRAVTAEGAVVASFSYDAYGNPVSATNSTSVLLPFQFAGGYTDPITGLIYLQERWYDPSSGQFLSRDPLEALTGEPYSYAGDNPVNETDPLGLFHYWITLYNKTLNKMQAREFITTLDRLAAGATAGSAAALVIPELGDLVGLAAAVSAEVLSETAYRLQQALKLPRLRFIHVRIGIGQMHYYSAPGPYSEVDLEFRSPRARPSVSLTESTGTNVPCETPQNRLA
jgi:RHS repeat-associated protein